MEEMSSLNMQTEQQIIDQVLNYTFEINDTVNLHVTINQEIGEKAKEYMESLKVARNIPYLDEIDNSHEGAKNLALSLFNQQERLYKQDSKEELPDFLKIAVQQKPKLTNAQLLDKAIKTWKAEVTMWINALQTEAFLLAIISEGILEVDGVNINRGFFTSQYIRGFRVYNVHPSIQENGVRIDPKYFDVKDINIQRQANNRPPVFIKDASDPHEQMLAVIDATKKSNPIFGLSLTTFFEDYAESINAGFISALMNARAEVVEYDDDGFLNDEVDGNLHAENVIESQKVGRKSRTPRSAVQ